MLLFFVPFFPFLFLVFLALACTGLIYRGPYDICTCINMLRTIYMLYGWSRVCECVRSALCLACWKLFELGKSESGKAGRVWVGLFLEWGMSSTKTNYVRAQGRSGSGQVRVLFGPVTPLSLVSLVSHYSPHIASSQLYCKTSGPLATRRPH